MTVVWIVFFAILIVSFITGIIITVIEEKKTSSFVVLDTKLLPDRIKLVQSKTTMVTEDNLEKTIKMSKIQLEEDVEALSLEKTLVMRPVEVETLENTMYFDKPILVTEFDEEII
ncbi:MAG: hypothetical protein J6C28_05535 [Bacilli bacterium]|nr:hypothetical protein [Bacilli bacterium]